MVAQTVGLRGHDLHGDLACIDLCLKPMVMPCGARIYVLILVALAEPTSALNRSSAGVARVTDTNCHIAPLSKEELTSFGTLERKKLVRASCLHRSALTLPCRETMATFVLALFLI